MYGCVVAHTVRTLCMHVQLYLQYIFMHVRTYTHVQVLDDESVTSERDLREILQNMKVGFSMYCTTAYVYVHFDNNMCTHTILYTQPNSNYVRTCAFCQ